MVKLLFIFCLMLFSCANKKLVQENKALRIANEVGRRSVDELLLDGNKYDSLIQKIIFDALEKEKSKQGY